MNSIKGVLDKSDYEGLGDYLNLQIDGSWLDETLDEHYPHSAYKGLIPTLLFRLEGYGEEEVVWNRILPAPNKKEICPILMCPDCRDFGCTLIVAEIENRGSAVQWNRLGINRTIHGGSETVGSYVHWLDKIGPFSFDKSEYSQIMQDFREHYEAERLKWEERNREYQAELSKKREKKRRQRLCIAIAVAVVWVAMIVALARLLP